MKVRYFQDTDTLYIEFRERDIFETRDLDDATLLDLDADGYVCAMTLEHASQRTDVSRLMVEGIAA
ncbi:MAG: DUF2283 domain-containing protein [Lamprobacter sp.]|uniref:DUF2283 domain-containing protein n=1 Tax=Lamprobacter sp. TaxID=3100796 RepID=UPI002B259EC2|nr:DUF2283 domain-containing protein [Lamprobacter sp.]MEA3643215.1 DUF2283 domain-containing protein [Lamprobacter sp.]